LVGVQAASFVVSYECDQVLEGPSRSTKEFEGTKENRMKSKKAVKLEKMMAIASVQIHCCCCIR